MNYIDLHCHLLPAVDDGPPNMEASLALARMLLSRGFTQIVATPHYIDDFSQHYRSRIQTQYSALKDALREHNLPLTVYLGGEVLLSPNLIALAEKNLLPVIHHTRYVLLELPHNQPLPLYTRSVIFNLQALSYRPILAHPERVCAFTAQPGLLAELANTGIMLQVNLGSLSGLYGRQAKKMAHTLLRSNMAQIIATDSHSPAQLQKWNSRKLAPLQPYFTDIPQQVLNSNTKLL
jgi:protein-tyrosine phosphatase